MIDSGEETNAVCPRCGDGFHCGVADDAPCGCVAVALAPQARRDIAARYDGCLCIACLQALANEGAERAARARATARRS